MSTRHVFFVVVFQSIQWRWYSGSHRICAADNVKSSSAQAECLPHRSLVGMNWDGLGLVWLERLNRRIRTPLECQEWSMVLTNFLYTDCAQEFRSTNPKMMQFSWKKWTTSKEDSKGEHDYDLVYNWSRSTFLSFFTKQIMCWKNMREKYYSAKLKLLKLIWHFWTRMSKKSAKS